MVERPYYEFVEEEKDVDDEEMQDHGPKYDHGHGPGHDHRKGNRPRRTGGYEDCDHSEHTKEDLQKELEEMNAAQKGNINHQIIMFRAVKEGMQSEYEKQKALEAEKVKEKLQARRKLPRREPNILRLDSKDSEDIPDLKQ